MRSCLFIALIYLPLFSTCQKKQVIINDNHGKISITINNYNTKTKDYVLNVSKYIDTSKRINLMLGGGVRISGFIPLAQLKKGYTINPVGESSTASGIIFHGGDKILSLKLVKGKLKISGEIFGFNQKCIAVIDNNKLNPCRSDYRLYVSDKYFELIDDYNIPVLQIELIKESNSIYLGGSFVDERGYNLFSKSYGVISKHYPTPILLMRQSERDSVLYEYLTISHSKLTVIHNQ